MAFLWLTRGTLERTSTSLPLYRPSPTAGHQVLNNPPCQRALVRRRPARRGRGRGGATAAAAAAAACLPAPVPLAGHPLGILRDHTAAVPA